MIEPKQNSWLLDWPTEACIQNSLTLKAKGSFFDFLKVQLFEDFVSLCPDGQKCRFSNSKRKIHILSCPKVFVFSIIWHQKPLAADICKVLASFNFEINTSGFSSENNKNYYIKALVFYNGFHYISYVFEEFWYRCDDTIVRPVGEYKDLVFDVVMTKMWPVAVFYDTFYRKNYDVCDEN